MGNLFPRRSSTEVFRTVYPCTTNSSDHLMEDRNAKFANNYVKTTKYSLLTFLPLNLWEQLHRFANCYFLFIVALNFMPRVEAFAKELAIIPVLAVLAFTAVKDGIEDLRRFRADQIVNNITVDVYSIDERKYMKRRWAEIQPGDFVKLHTNETIPADILLLKSSEVSGLCHIETANLDGEANLKQRECVRSDQIQPFTPEEFQWGVEVEAPNAELYQFSGRILTPTVCRVRKENLLLRGCMVRNTDSVEGMVIYAGCETKAMLNNSGSRFKRSKMERRLNRDIFWCVLILLILCTFGSVGSYIWLNSLPGGNILFLNSQESDNAALSAFINFWTFVIILQAVIPLPLYITIEAVKVIQVFFLHNDIELYDPKRDSCVAVHAFNIPEDLGQIEYVFCDKTGTLTENRMVFKRAFINGVDYYVDEEIPMEVINNDAQALPDRQVNPTVLLSSVREFIPFVSLPCCPETDMSRTCCPSISHSSPSLDGLGDGEVASPQSRQASTRPGQPSDHFATETSARRNCRRVQDFFLCITICNTCVVSANKNAPAALVPPRKRNRFARLREAVRPRGPAPGVGGDNQPAQSSWRFRRFFIRGSRDEIFEVGEDAAQQKLDEAPTEEGGDRSERDSSGGRSSVLYRSINKSLSIGSLFGAWRQKFASTATAGVNWESTEGSPNVSPALIELPEQVCETKQNLRSRLKAKLSTTSEVNSCRAPVASFMKTSNVDDVEKNTKDSFNVITDNELRAPRCSTPAIRQTLFQPNPRPTVSKHSRIILQSTQQQPLAATASLPPSTTTTSGGAGVAATAAAQDFDDWEALSQAGSSTRWRSSLCDRSVHHICPLSENTLINGYESESPDEVTLVRTACKYGCKLLQRGLGFVIIWLPGDGLIRVEVLKTLPFETRRKRMSIIIRHPDTDQIVLYCKGADSVILPRLDPLKGQTFKSSTEESLKEYSRSGLRTLVMAKRVILESEYQRWSSKWTEAEEDYRNSEELKFKLMDDIETSMELLGATGIEDSLQEGVPETIAALRDAGMKIWVLTGDKQETAISIAYAAKLISDDQRVLILSANSIEDVKGKLEDFLMNLLPGANQATSESIYINSTTLQTSRSFHKHSQFSAPENTEMAVEGTPATAPFPTVSIIDNEVPVDLPREGVALVLDSSCLPYVLQDEVKDDFIKLAQMCSSVICCRVTPSQKASVVQLVKRELGVQTLAVGDGANDVNMIQCADVGVGISGQEGTQAAMASDFAITQFAFLRRLLLVHGHRCYDKLARMALYMFYKDAVYIFSLFWFQFFNGFSGSAHINQLAQVLFNISFTSLPPFVLGVLDNSLDDRTLMANPKLYRSGRDSMAYKPWHFWLNTLDAMWQSLVIFFLPCLVFFDSNTSMDELGTTCMNALVFTSLVHVALETRSFTYLHAVVYVGSYAVLWLFFTMVYNAVGVTRLAPDPPYWVIFVLMGDWRFWLCMLITCPTALLPRLLLNSLLNTFAPSLDILAAQLAKKHESGSVLPIGHYVNEYDASQRRPRRRHLRGVASGEPNNLRSRIMQWFTSAGALLQRMPTLRRHITEPAVVLVRSVSLLWPNAVSNPELVAHTLPRVEPVVFMPPHDLQRTKSFTDFRGCSSSLSPRDQDDQAGPYVTNMSQEAFKRPKWSESPRI